MLNALSSFVSLHVLELSSFAHERKMTIWFAVVDKEEKKTFHGTPLTFSYPVLSLEKKITLNTNSYQVLSRFKIGHSNNRQGNAHVLTEVY